MKQSEVGLKIVQAGQYFPSVDCVEEKIARALLQLIAVVDCPAPSVPLLHRRHLGLLFNLVIIAYLEHTCTYWNLLTHDYALSDTLNRVLLALDRRVVEVVGRHLKACQHQHRVLHLLDAKTCDAQHLSLIGHFVSEE